MPDRDFVDSGRFGAFGRSGPCPDPPKGWTWERLMEMALNEARMAADCGDVPVGALVAAKNGRLLAVAANRVERDADPAGHAEILALRAAAQAQGAPRLTDCILVVTLEPCLMCVGAIAHARIEGIVYGAADLRAGAVASSVDSTDLPLAGRSFWHMGGIKSGQCARLLQDFFIKRRCQTI